jgi:hypothetical protein
MCNRITRGRPDSPNAERQVIIRTSDSWSVRTAGAFRRPNPTPLRSRLCKSSVSTDGSVIGYTIRQPSVAELTCDLDVAQTLVSAGAETHLGAELPRTLITGYTIRRGRWRNWPLTSLSPAKLPAPLRIGKRRRHESPRHVQFFQKGPDGGPFLMVILPRPIRK